MDVKKYIANKKRLIDKALDGYLPCASEKPKTIHKAMRYAVFSGGKRIRPILTLASFEACGGKGASIMPVACAIEIIHTYTLIHDDLPCMDNDDYRRGRSSCHKRFSEDLALLAGDALLTLGFQLLSDGGKIDIVREVSKAIGSRGTIGGQVVDIEQKHRCHKGTGQTEEGREKTDLDYITSRKTGALFAMALKAGCMFKGAGKKKIDAIANFGKHIGFTFQLIDDLIDKDGHVKAYGERHVRKMAGLLSERAKGYLSIFGNKADRLSEIADLILDRKS